MLTFRFFIEQETLFKLNKREKIPEIYLICFEVNCLNQFKEIFKDKNYMKYKIYQLRNKILFFSYHNIKLSEFYKSIMKRVYAYLKEKRLYKMQIIIFETNFKI